MGVVFRMRTALPRKKRYTLNSGSEWLSVLLSPVSFNEDNSGFIPTRTCMGYQ